MTVLEINMTGNKPRYSKEEHARRGTEIYESQIRAQIDPEHQGRIVAIDVDTGIFEVADNSISACEGLLARLPNAQIWCVRVGQPAVHHFGPRARAVRA